MLTLESESQAKRLAGGQRVDLLLLNQTQTAAIKGWANDKYI
jgi:hypothetical protein